MMTKQEEMWQGEFGDEYTSRNDVSRNVASNAAFFSRALQRAFGIRRVIELGCGSGQNLEALSCLLPDADLVGVEINPVAAQMVKVGRVFRKSIYEFEPSREEQADLAFTKGLLIHVPPDKIDEAYAKLFNCSSRYILVAEYFNPTPTMVNYRGHQDLLWKRDFAKEMMRAYPSLVLTDYGFKYHMDRFPQDNLHWFLMEKM